MSPGSLLTLLLVFSLAPSAVAQQRVSELRWHFVDRATIPDPGEDMPEHVRLLYADVVDMREVQRAFDEYYAKRDADAPFEDLERDPYAKFFHQWFRAARDFVGDDGVVRALDTRRLARRRSRTNARAWATDSNPPPSATWSFVGPERTRWRADHEPGQPAAPWQVNIYSVAVAPSDPSTLYCGSETGVLYKSVDKGLNWEPFDNFNWGGAISAVAVHPTSPDIAFAASHADVFRTTDGGASWDIVLTQSGLSCNSLAISPSTPTTLFAGAATGLWRSTDSGDTWAQVLAEHVDDIEFRPGDGSTLYVLTRTGSPDTFTFYKSTNGGASFAPSMTGWGTLYEHSGGRLTVTPAGIDHVYAILLTENDSGGDQKPVILKSTDAAVTWSTAATCNGGSCLLNSGQGYYDLDIVASHVNPEHVIAATTSAYRSTDGGTTWSLFGGYGGAFDIHPDIQAMVSIMDGGTENTWIATDGGTNLSTDFYGNPAHWEARIDGLDGTDFWGYAQDWNEDFLVGGRYHNGNTAISDRFPPGQALRLGGAESVTGWMLHGRERYAAFDDIEELILPASIDAAPEASAFLFTKHPHNFYYGDAFSRVLVDPEDFMTVYLGEGQSFWRSRDGGASWEDTHTFNGSVYHFDISRANPDIIYLTTDRGLRRSLDRGETFHARPKPPGMTDWHAQNFRVAASATDEDTLWVLNQRSSATSTAGRVFVSHDGGGTWTDLTTAMLHGRQWTALAHQAGTNGGIYIASRRGEPGTNPARVLYRDATMADWVDHSDGLPASANPIKLLPFYRDGKLRWAGNRGVWEIDFYEPNWTPIAQAFVSGRNQICVRDIVEFDSYSVCRGSATCQWNIPGASWTSALDQREVQATFPSPGTYSATLTIDQDGFVDTSTVSVTITDECGVEASPGNALSLSGAAGDYAATSKSLGITTNTFTISAWIKRDGPQEPYAGIVFMRTGTAHGLNFVNGTNLGFHWNNQEWWWDSGLRVPNNEWAHVAMVVNPTRTRLYLNGVLSANQTDPPLATFDGTMNFGADPPWGERRFRGEIDEVRIYDRSLNKTEIRELMHLTQRPDDEPNLVGYWQFNRAAGQVTDRAGINHANLIGGATRVPSLAPVGAGVSAVKSITSAGSYDFEGTGVTLTFGQGASSFPEGDVLVTRVDRAPDVFPDDVNVLPSTHWIVHNYGDRTSFSELDSLTFVSTDVPGFAPSAPAGTVRLYRREATGGSAWGQAVDRSDGGSATSVVFREGNGQTTLGQYTLSFDPPKSKLQTLR